MNVIGQLRREAFQLHQKGEGLVCALTQSENELVPLGLTVLQGDETPLRKGLVGAAWTVRVKSRVRSLEKVLVEYRRLVNALQPHDPPEASRSRAAVIATWERKIASSRPTPQEAELGDDDWVLLGDGGAPSTNASPLSWWWPFS